MSLIPFTQDRVERIVTPSAELLGAPPCEYSSAAWERALRDLDAIHRDATDFLYFTGHKYLLHSTSITVENAIFHYDFIAEQVTAGPGWRALCVVFVDDEPSPCEADEDYTSEADLTEYEGWCTICQRAAQRNCSMCDIGICDACSYEKTLCKWCLMDGAADM